jgi:tagatose 6-phosphate kinase
MILVVGLSSVWQRTLFFKGFHLGEVNRAGRVLETASGKGVNVARVATTLGLPARVLTVAGGRRGRLFARALRADGVPARIIPADGETRLCQTLVAGDVVTEVVEESPALSQSEVRAVVSTFRASLRRAQAVVFSGTVPRGCGDDFYARLARRARKCGVPFVVDTQGTQLLRVVGEGPILVKINSRELAAATGKEQREAGVAELLKLGAQRVVITDGPRGAWAADSQGQWHVRAPRVTAVNPIGSGDAMLAGLLVGLVRGSGLQEALQFGVVCGAANALTETSGVVRRGDVRRLLRQV